MSASASAKSLGKPLVTTVVDEVGWPTTYPRTVADEPFWVARAGATEIGVAAACAARVVVGGSAVAGASTANGTSRSRDSTCVA